MIRLIINKLPHTRLRWTLLLLFPLASIASGSEMVLYFGSAFLACAWLLYRIDTFNVDTLPIWLILFLFLILYYLRYPILLADFTPYLKDAPDRVRVLYGLDHNASFLSVGLKISNVVFCIFCIVTGFLYKKTNYFPMVTHVASSGSRRKVSAFMISLLVCFMVVLGWVSYSYNIGRMGVDPGEPLPFRLKGVIFYARHVVTPLLILAIMLQAERLMDRRAQCVGWGLLMLHGVGETLLRGSRSSILLCLLLVIFLIASRGLKIKPSKSILLMSLVGGAIFLFPVITHYRILQFQPDSSSYENIFFAFESMNTYIFSVIMTSVSDIYFRLPGVETIGAINGLINSPAETTDGALEFKFLEIIGVPFGMAGYLTFNIYQTPMPSYTLYAPGFVGWFYLAGSWAGVIVGGFLLALLCTWLPRCYYAIDLRWAPLINTFFLWVLFVFLTDGTLDSNYFLIAVGSATLIVLEIFTRMKSVSS